MFVRDSAARLLLVMIPWAALAGQGKPGPWFCISRDFVNKAAYASPIFTLRPEDLTKVNPAWHQLLSSKYHVTKLPPQSCRGPYQTVAAADSLRSQQIKDVESLFKKKVVQLDWTYGGAAALTVDSASKPPSKTKRPTGTP